MEPIRNILRQKKATVKFYEAEATKIDYEKRVVYISDDSEIKGDVAHTEVPFDMLVIGVGAENATFGECSRATARSRWARLTICRYSGCPRELVLPEGG
jgi:NADH dehydrogenase FAD-containing subunit